MKPRDWQRLIVWSMFFPAIWLGLTGLVGLLALPSRLGLPGLTELVRMAGMADLPIFLSVPNGWGQACAWAAEAPREEVRIHLENRDGGDIRGSRDGGRSWVVLGTVIGPCGRAAETDKAGFTAADWAPDSSVAACAVNAMHIKTRRGRKHSVLFTVQPYEFRQRTVKTVKSYFSPTTSLYTDIPAGTGIFGSAWAPRLGSTVLVKKGDAWVPFSASLSPRPGQEILITSWRPAAQLRQVKIRNHEFGLVTGVFDDGTVKALGRVYKPVGATGRFAGSEFAAVGEIRANHPGVLCISTAPRGRIGGFQLIPATHARRDNLSYVWNGGVPAWLIVGPLLPWQPPIEGTAPLFAGHCLPGSGTCDIQRGGPPWEPLPELIGLHPRGLADVTDLRIFPPLRSSEEGNR
jgi:hypothetical protein